MVSEMVARGRFASVEEALETGLAAIDQTDAAAAALFDDWDDASLADLNASIAESIAELDAGLGIPLTHDVIDEVKREGRWRLTGR